jgi:hypothetical protein
MIEKIIHAMQVSIDADVRMVLNPAECQAWLIEIERLRAELAAKDAEIERLKALLKPIGYHDVEQFYKDDEEPPDETP